MKRTKQKKGQNIGRVAACLALSLSLQFSQYAFAAEPVLRTLSFTPATGDVINPERGLMTNRQSTDMWGMSGLRVQGISVVQILYNILAFNNAPISAAKIAELRAACQLLRANGLKGIVRAAYGYTSSDYYKDPKDMALIQTHIKQIAAVLSDYQDVVFHIQAGFLGPWGEWHGSNFGSPPSLSARKAVLFSLLDALPTTTTVAIRTPSFIRDIFAGEAGGNKLTADTAYSGSRLSRTAFHNDCFLSSSSDYGTYSYEYTRAQEMDWYNNHGRYAQFGGETCDVAAQSDAANAVSEMTKLHISYLNREYNKNVLTKWQNSTFAGAKAYDYMTSRFGYRFVMSAAQVSTQVRPGGALHTQFKIKNLGFASLHNARNVEIVLQQGNVKYTAKVAVDPRRWEPESGEITLDWYFRLPSDMAAGNWSIYLNLPDPMLSSDARYSIQLANQGVFNATTGYNLIANDLVINPSIGGSVEIGSVFKQIDPSTITEPEPVAISVDGKFTVPTEWDYAPLVSKMTGPLLNLKMVQQGTNLFLAAEGLALSKYTNFTVFLDTDGNAGTGYLAAAPLGAEYMIENGTLYKYTGNGTSWAWASKGAVTFSRGDSLIEVKITFASLGLTTLGKLKASFVLKDSSWNVVDTLAK